MANVTSVVLRKLSRPRPEWIPKKNKTGRPFLSLSVCQPITHCLGKGRWHIVRSCSLYGIY